MADITMRDSFSSSLLACAFNLHNNNTESRLVVKSLAAIASCVMAVVVVPFALLEGIARKLGSIVLQITGTLNPESRLGRFHAGLIRTFNTQGTLLFHIDTMILATGTIWTLGHPNRDLPDCDDLINRNCLHIALNRPSATRED